MQGIVDLRVWPGIEADGNNPTTTPGKVRDNGKEQMQRLAKLTKKHRNGHISKVDWLDRLTFRELELINEKEKRSSNYLYLMVEFPSITVDNIPNYIVYFEQDGDDVYQFRVQADIVTVPDQEILKVRIFHFILTISLIINTSYYFLKNHFHFIAKKNHNCKKLLQHCCRKCNLIQYKHTFSTVPQFN